MRAVACVPPSPIFDAREMFFDLADGISVEGHHVRIPCRTSVAVCY